MQWKRGGFAAFREAQAGLPGALTHRFNPGEISQLV